MPFPNIDSVFDGVPCEILLEVLYLQYRTCDKLKYPLQINLCLSVLGGSSCVSNTEHAKLDKPVVAQEALYAAATRSRANLEPS
jgi:hypothetical protein